MKVAELFENKAEKVVRTETGEATLYPNGTMHLDNSGYEQMLTKEQVQAAWRGATILPLSPDMVKELQKDYAAEHLELAIEQSSPRWDGDYWDFGDESHAIPDQEDFDRPQSDDY